MSPDLERSVVDLLARVGPRMKRIAASFRIPAAEAEDLLQEACLALVQSWERLQCPEAWLTRTLWCLCAQRARRRRREALQALTEALIPAERPVQERIELWLDLKVLCSLLPRRYRLLLQLRYGLGLSAEETAARLGCQPGSIGKLNARALARLRRGMAR